MAQEYLTLEKAAEVLGLSPAEVNQLRERNELRAFRDGANWKFKADEVQNKLAELIKKRRPSAPASDDEQSGDVLLSEHELGTGDPGASGTVIGPSSGKSASSSDLQIVGSDVDLVGSGVDLLGSDLSPANSDVFQTPPGAGGAAASDLALSLGDKTPAPGATPGPVTTGDSNIELAEGVDDDLVLGGSGTGSDITIGGDSGISLVDPADSGLSLEEPLDLGGGDESLELGEDDLLNLSEEAAPAAGGDEEFRLTPMEEEGADEESGSQVIALDSELTGDEAATMVAGAAPGPEGFGGMGSAPRMGMLEAEELGGMGPAPAMGAVPAVPLGAPIGQPALTPVGYPTATLPEAPYSTGVIVMLAVAVVLLIFPGIMTYDLLRNMWSWNQPYTVNSSLMDLITGLF